MTTRKPSPTAGKGLEGLMGQASASFTGAGIGV
jgi:hypothetical protein